MKELENREQKKQNFQRENLKNITIFNSIFKNEADQHKRSEHQKEKEIEVKLVADSIKREKNREHQEY